MISAHIVPFEKTIKPFLNSSTLSQSVQNRKTFYCYFLLWYTLNMGHLDCRKTVEKCLLKLTAQIYEYVKCTCGKSKNKSMKILSGIAITLS